MGKFSDDLNDMMVSGVHRDIAALVGQYDNGTITMSDFLRRIRHALNVNPMGDCQCDACWEPPAEWADMIAKAPLPAVVDLDRKNRSLTITVKEDYYTSAAEDALAALREKLVGTPETEDSGEFTEKLATWEAELLYGPYVVFYNHQTLFKRLFSASSNGANEAAERIFASLTEKEQKEIYRVAKEDANSSNRGAIRIRIVKGIRDALGHKNAPLDIAAKVATFIIDANQKSVTF